MCRWLAYSGGAIALSELIFHTHHSLIDQSLDARLGPTPTNGDGFGAGWYDWRDEPGLFRSTQPAWNDSNLQDLCDHVRSPLFLAHIRASTGSPVQYSNCHPFRHGKWLFVHNGAINGFERIRRRLLAELDDEHFQGIQGSTDSEIMFLLAIQFGLEDNPRLGVQRMAGFIERIGGEAGIKFPMQMTVGISDGASLYAARYSSEHMSRTLYHSGDLAELHAMDADLPPSQRALLEQMTLKARAIVSEPLSEMQALWEPIPESSFTTVEDGEISIVPFQAAPP